MGSGFDNSQPVRRLRQKERATELFCEDLLTQTCFLAPFHNPPILFLTDWAKGRGKGVGGLGGGKGKAARLLDRNDRTGCRAGLAI